MVAKHERGDGEIRPVTRFALYGRVSTAEQADGLSLGMQFAAMRGKAEAEGVIAGCWDDVETGRNDERGGYRAMLAASKAWDVLLVWRCDRLGRDAAELFRVAKELRRAGKRLVSVTENVDDPFVMGLHFLLAQRESWLIGERVRPVMLRLAAEGAAVTRPPLGYVAARDGAGRPTLAIDEAGAALYLEAVARVEAGASVRSVVVAWNGRGVAAPNGGPWNHTSLRKILRNPTHCGLVRRRGLAGPVAGNHPPLIDRERWAALQATLDAAGAARSFVAAAPNAWLLSGFIRCACGAACNHQAAPNRRAGGARHYYACNARKHGRPCPIPGMVRCDDLEAAVRFVMAPILDGDAAALEAHQRRRWRAAAAGEDGDRGRERRRLMAEAARWETKLERLREDRNERVITADDYHRDRERYEAARRAAVAALAALPGTKRMAAPEAARAAESLALVGRMWDRASIDERRAFLRLAGLAIAREPDGYWVRVSADFAVWTRGDAWFPLVGPPTRKDGARGRLRIPDA